MASEQRTEPGEDCADRTAVHGGSSRIDGKQISGRYRKDGATSQPAGTVVYTPGKAATGSACYSG